MTKAQGARVAILRRYPEFIDPTCTDSTTEQRELIRSLGGLEFSPGGWGFEDGSVLKHYRCPEHPYWSKHPREAQKRSWKAYSC